MRFDFRFEVRWVVWSSLEFVLGEGLVVVRSWIRVLRWLFGLIEEAMVRENSYRYWLLLEYKLFKVDVMCSKGYLETIVVGNSCRSEENSGGFPVGFDDTGVGALDLQDIPSSAALSVIRPALGRQHSISDGAKAVAYFYHGLMLDEGDREKPHGMAVAAL
ncbi:hypothetical protein Droror1_Dr00017918 [Drosera rotundifolia]